MVSAAGEGSKGEARSFNHGNQGFQTEAESDTLQQIDSGAGYLEERRLQGGVEVIRHVLARRESNSEDEEQRPA